MLKIKDNVDLKELEKFGFWELDEKYRDDYDFFHFKDKYIKYECSGRRGQEYYLLINKESRIISIYATKPDGDGCPGRVSNILYDLIQAGLVEKDEKGEK